MEDRWGENFMSKRLHLIWRAPRIVPAIDIVLQPKRVLDVGCAVGDLIDEFLIRGIDAWGIDISPWAKDYATKAARDRILIEDFTRPDWPTHPLTNSFDLVMAVEFFSILDVALHDCAVDNMLKVGTKHFLVCCGEDKRFGLKEKFLGAGLTFNGEAVEEIRWCIHPLREKLAFKAFYNGLMIFQR